MNEKLLKELLETNQDSIEGLTKLVKKSLDNNEKLLESMKVLESRIKVLEGKDRKLKPWDPIGPCDMGEDDKLKGDEGFKKFIELVLDKKGERK